ncbi:integrase [Photobacterium leiognathi]|uniref:integrase n=1 Tax=Photobacterium leiognathi TaxID=553611 RepID=UPI001EE08D99|nr:integrase [Photobacterium leiognathi]
MLDKSEIYSRFKERNKEHFFRLLFPFSKEENAAIAKEVIRLCTLLSDKYLDYFEEYDFLIEEAQKHQDVSSTDTMTILKKITKDKMIGEHPIPSFICSTLLRTSYDENKFDQYKALALLTAARLSYMGEHHSKVKELCDEIRKFSDGRRENLASFLPNIDAVNFTELVHQFSSLIDNSSQLNTTRKVVNQLNHYKVPFKAAHDLNAGYRRNANTQRFRKNGALTVKPSTCLNDEGDSAVEISQLHFGPKYSENWQGEDYADSDTRSLNIVISSNNCLKNEALGAMHAKAIFENLKKKAMHLPCHIYNMTDHELHTLVKSCEDTILSGQDENIAKLLLLMLLTGSTEEQVKRAKPYKNEHRQLKGISRVHRLPSQSIRDELKFLTQKVSTSIWFPLPDFITTNLNSFKFKKVLTQDLKDFLQSINQQKRLHLTLTKISSYLSYYSAHVNIDPIIPHIISGNDNKVLPAVFYTQTQQSSLLEHYLDYIRHLFSLSESLLWHTSDEYEDDNDEFIGSPLHIEKEKLTDLFTFLKARIHSNKSKVDIYFSEQGHNDITLMTQFVLMLASGYRPVTGWFGKREDFHLPTATYWISDKNISMGDNSRCILLADIAVLYLKHYINYLDEAVRFQGNRSLYLKQRYEKSLTSEEHLFFYRENDIVYEVIPSHYAQFVDSLFPLQPNWARHHIRSLLCKHAISPELISAWMGHQDMGKQAFNSFSQLNQKQLKQVSHIINQLLIELGLGDNL